MITYLFYAVAPPWIAVPNVTQILTQSVDVNLGIPVFESLFDFLCPNLYAAFPEDALSYAVAGFPLFAVKIWRTEALPVLALPVGTWFSAVYLGEHYFVDVLGGIAYATVAFVAVEKFLPLFHGAFNFFKKIYSPV